MHNNDQIVIHVHLIRVPQTRLLDVIICFICGAPRPCCLLAVPKFPSQTPHENPSIYLAKIHERCYETSIIDGSRATAYEANKTIAGHQASNWARWQSLVAISSTKLWVWEKEPACLHFKLHKLIALMRAGPGKGTHASNASHRLSNHSKCCHTRAFFAS